MILQLEYLRPFVRACILPIFLRKQTLSVELIMAYSDKYLRSVDTYLLQIRGLPRHHPRKTQPGTLLPFLEVYLVHGPISTWSTSHRFTCCVEDVRAQSVERYPQTTTSWYWTLPA